MIARHYQLAETAGRRETRAPRRIGSVSRAGSDLRSPRPGRACTLRDRLSGPLPPRDRSSRSEDRRCARAVALCTHSLYPAGHLSRPTTRGLVWCGVCLWHGVWTKRRAPVLHTARKDVERLGSRIREALESRHLASVETELLRPAGAGFRANGDEAGRPLADPSGNATCSRSPSPSWSRPKSLPTQLRQLGGQADHPGAGVSVELPGGVIGQRRSQGVPGLRREPTSSRATAGAGASSSARSSCVSTPGTGFSTTSIPTPASMRCSESRATRSTSIGTARSRTKPGPSCRALQSIEPRCPMRERSSTPTTSRGEFH